MRIDRRTFLGGAAVAGLNLGLSWTSSARSPSKKLVFPELTVSGSPGQLGLTHGKTFAPLVKNNVAFYLTWLGRATGASRKRLLEVALQFSPVLRDHLPAQLEEMRGIAKGAGCTLGEILAVNARTDMLVMGRRKPARAAVRSNPGCTALALRGGTGAKPLLALGQNWDWRQELQKGVVLLRLSGKDQPRMLTFTEAGMLGKIGFNEHRLGVCLNFLSHKTERPDRPFGVPVHCLLRAVMGCQTIEQAYKLVAWAPRCASANFLMAQHHKGASVALDLEWTPTAVGRLDWADPGLVHTNHFIDPVLHAGCEGAGGKSTENRAATARRQAAALMRVVPDPARRMKKVLACRKGAPYAVSKSSAPDSPSLTLAGIVMDLSRNRLHLCKGPPHAGRWLERPGV